MSGYQFQLNNPFSLDLKGAMASGVLNGLGLDQNNPFGAAGTSFINSVFQGGNVWDAIGGAAAQMGTQVAFQMTSSVFNAIGGAIGGGISAATAKAQNAKAENDMKKNQNDAERVADNGVSELSNVVTDADAKISGYNTQIADLQNLITESAHVAEATKEDLTSQVTVIQQKIAEFEQKQIEREAIKRQLESCDDESKKAELQKQLGAKDAELEGLSTGINDINTQIVAIRTSVQTAQAEAYEAANQALAIQAESVEFEEGIQEALDVTSAEIAASVKEKVAASASAGNQLNALGQQEITAAENQQKSSALLSCTGVGALFGAANAASGLSLLAIGQGAKSDASTGLTTLAGVVGGFGTKFNSLNPALGQLTGNSNDLAASVEAFNASVEEFNNFATELINNTNIYSVPAELKKSEEEQAA